MTRLRTLLFLLLFPLTASALVGPAVPIGITEPRLGNGIDRSPSIATNGDQFFVVWEETRNRHVIRGARLDGDGTVLDPDGILISTDGDAPAIAWNGYAWAITWFTGIGYMGRLYGTDGQPLGPPIGISWSYEHTSILAVADERIATLLHGSHILIMNRELYGMKEIQPAFVNGYAALASDGNDFLFATANTPELGGGFTLTHLDRDGNVLGTSKVARPSVGPMAAAWSGSHYWVVWLEASPSGVVTAHAVSVSSDGAAGTPLALGPVHDYYYTPTLIGLSDGSAIAYVNATGTIAIQLSASGSVTSTPIAMSLPKVAVNARGEMIGVWIDGAVRSAQLRPDGTPADNGQWLVRTPSSSSVPVTDRDGGSPLVAFRVENGSTRDIVVRNAAGGPPQVIATSSDSIVGPTLAGNGTSTLTAWTTCNSALTACTIDAAFLPPNGAPRTLRLAATKTANAPAIVWTGSLYAVIWEEGPTIIDIPELRMVRVSDTGNVLDSSPVHLASGAFGNLMATSLAHGDGVTLVVWDEALVFCTCRQGRPHTLRALRLDETGNPIDSAPVTLTSFTAFDNFQSLASTSAAWDGIAFTVIWNHGGVIDGVRMLPSGFFSPFLTSTIRTYLNPVIAAHGRELLMVWLDSANRLLAGTIETSGAVVDAGGFESPLLIAGYNLAHLGGDGFVLLSTEVLPDQVTIGTIRTVTTGRPAAHRRSG